MQERMRAVKFRAMDFMALEDYEIGALGDWTLIEGSNEKGKSSILQALQVALSGKHHGESNDDIVRLGKDLAEVQVVFDNGIKVDREFPRGGKAKLNVRHPEFGVLSSPVARLGKFIDSAALSPAAFMQATPADRQRVLMESIPMELEDDRICKATGVSPAHVADVSRSVAGLHPLALIDLCRKAWAGSRKAINDEIKRKGATAEQLAQSLPEDAQEKTDWAQRSEALASEKTAIERELDRGLNGIRESFTKIKSNTQQAYTQTCSRLHSAADEEIRAFTEGVRRKERTDVEAAGQHRDKATQDAKDLGDKMATDLGANARPKIDALAVELGAAKERRDTAARTSNMRAVHNQMLSEIDVHRAQVVGWQNAIDGIEKLKQELLEDIPISGMEFVDGRLLFDGIPFEVLNTAQKIDICVDVAILRCKNLGLSDVVILDDLEHLDSEHMAALKVKAEVSGLQWICGRVKDGPLSVTVENWKRVA